MTTLTFHILCIRSYPSGRGMNKKRVLEQLSPNWTIRIDDSEVIEIDVSTVEDRKKLEHDLVHKCNNVAARIELGK